MIRTPIVELSTLAAIAFRRKVRGGHTAIVIQRFDGGQPGQGLLNRNTGEADPSHNTQLDRFPKEAFDEAVELTRFLPFNARGQVSVAGWSQSAAEEPEDDGEDDVEELATVCSREYAAIVDAYTNRKGELSYDLLNKDFIQFAKGSKVVSDMVSDRASVEQIREYIVGKKLENLTGNKDLSGAQVHRIVEMLDSVSRKGVFKELNDEIRKLLAR
jgi:hypothetical protein